MPLRCRTVRPTPYAYTLELLFRALHVTIGRCRFEGTTFRSVGLAVPVVRRAEALVGDPLVGAKLTHYERGRPYGWLTRRRHAANLFKVG